MPDWFEEEWPFDRYWRAIERMLRMWPTFRFPAFPEIERIAPTADISETDDEIIIRVDMPGIRKEDIDLTVREDFIDIRAERRIAKEVEREHYFRRERAYRGYHRAFTLPLRIDPKTVRAEYKAGILTITAKKAEKVRKGIKIKVK